jgi:hypothetical protein
MNCLIAPMHSQRKGMGLSELVPLGVAFVVIAFTISMGAEILQSLYDGQTANSYARNATGEGLVGIC